MIATRRTLLEYVSSNGRNYFRKWFDGLAEPARKKVEARLTRAEEGNLGETKPVGEGVSEMRIDFEPGLRVYYGEDRSQVVILLAGGDKTTQARDIALAKRLWNEYKNERKNATR